MRTYNNQNNDETMNGGKMSKLAKSVLAAGLAVGGAASFGEMDVFAAEGDGDGPAAQTQGDTAVEQP